MPSHSQLLPAWVPLHILADPRPKRFESVCAFIINMLMSASTSAHGERLASGRWLPHYSNWNNMVPSQRFSFLSIRHHPLVDTTKARTACWGPNMRPCLDRMTCCSSLHMVLDPSTFQKRLYSSPAQRGRTSDHSVKAHGAAAYATSMGVKVFVSRIYLTWLCECNSGPVHTI